MNTNKDILVKTQKFRKQSTVLQKHLMNFLSWRENRQSQMFGSSDNIARSDWFFQTEAKLTQLKSLASSQSLSSPRSDRVLFPNHQDSQFIGHFFPHKKAFVHYWVFPFVGFAAYLARTQSSEPLRTENKICQVDSTLANKSRIKNKNFLFAETPNQLKPSFTPENVCFLKNLKTSQVQQLEKEEFDYFWDLYSFFKKTELQNFIYTSLIPDFRPFKKTSVEHFDQTPPFSLGTFDCNVTMNSNIPSKLSLTPTTADGLSDFDLSRPFPSYNKAASILDDLLKRSSLDGLSNTQNTGLSNNALAKKLKTEFLSKLQATLNVSNPAPSNYAESLFYDNKLARQSEASFETTKFLNQQIQEKLFFDFSRLFLIKAGQQRAEASNSVNFDENKHQSKELNKTVNHLQKQLKELNGYRTYFAKTKFQTANARSLLEFEQNNSFRKQQSLNIKDFMSILNKIRDQESLRLLHSNFPSNRETITPKTSGDSLTEALKWLVYELSLLRSFKNQQTPTVKLSKHLAENVILANPVFDSSPLTKQKSHSVPTSSVGKNSKNELFYKKLDLTAHSGQLEILANKLNLTSSKRLQTQKSSKIMTLHQPIQVSFSPKFDRDNDIDQLLNFRQLLKTQINKYSIDYHQRLFSNGGTRELDSSSKPWIESHKGALLRSPNLLGHNAGSLLQERVSKLQNLLQQYSFKFIGLMQDKQTYFIEKQTNSRFTHLNVEPFYSSLSFQSNKKFVLNFKNKLQKQKKEILYKNSDTRKQEKIFRLYLSCKSKTDSFSLKSLKEKQNVIPDQTFFCQKIYLEKILKTLKNASSADSAFVLTRKTSNKLYRLDKNHSNTSSNPGQKSMSSIASQPQFKYPPETLRYSPTTLLRRIGFLFSYKSELTNKETIKRLEKQRSQQKKHRRKKRKRFYPRPNWTRFLLYKNFLARRHSSGTSSSAKFSLQNTHTTNNVVVALDATKKSNVHIFTKGETVFSSAKGKKKKENRRVKTENSSLKSWTPVILTNKIYRNQKNQWGVRSEDQGNREKRLLNRTKSSFSLPSLNHHDYYKISNQAMSDFQRLCWKSYWLRSSLTPYIRRIQNSLTQMREIQSAYQPNPAASVLSPEVAISPTLGAVPSSSQLFWYLNLKNASPKTAPSSFTFYNEIQNRADYDRILYDRMMDIIHNVKANLNGNGQNRPKSFKVGRSKKDNFNLRRPFSMTTNRSNSKKSNNLGQESNFVVRYLADFGLFVDKTFNQPQVRAFSLSSLMDSSIKPYGDLPTLRTLWALSKTNTLGLGNTQNKQSPKGMTTNETKELWNRLKYREQSSSNKTKKFFRTSWNKFVLSPLGLRTKNLETISPPKLHITEKKLNYLGIDNSINRTGTQEKLRHLKLKFKQTPDKFKSKVDLGVLEHSRSSLEDTFSHSVKNSQAQKQTKRSIHFWWSFPPFGSEITTANFDWRFELPKTSGSSDIVVASLYTCTVLFHLCCLFSLLQISEIRSVSKFYLLILYKLSTTYLVLTYAVFEGLKNYFTEFSNISAFLKEKLGQTELKNVDFQMEKDQTLIYSSLSQKSQKNMYTLQYLKFPSTDSESLAQSYQLDEQQENQRVLQTSETALYLNFKPDLKNLNAAQRFHLLEMYFSLPNFNFKNALEKQVNFKRQHNKLFYSIPKNATTFVYSVLYLLFKNSTKAERQKLQSSTPNQLSLLQTQAKLNLKLSVQNLSSLVWLSTLTVSKTSVSLVYNCFGVGSFVLFKIIDVLESLMMIIYKFLEKPAELMIEWIAQLFLVEWSSDITSFIPESFDIYTWRSLTKLSRGSRVFAVFGFLMQRRIWSFFEIFLNLLTKPDADLLARQKKGMIFWDVWAEILMIAAEKYRINLASLTTIKEEQDAFLERLINDPNWLSSLSEVSPNSETVKLEKQTRALAELEFLTTMGDQPDSWWGRKSFFYKNMAKTLNTNPDNSVKTQNMLNNQMFNNAALAPLKNQEFYNATGQNNQMRQATAEDLKSAIFAFSENNKSIQFTSDFRQNWKLWQRWSTNQHFTSQGTDTDLFVDIHPPKAFAQLSALKASQSGISGGVAGIHTLGLLTCQIYSGLFSKQVAKNILVVGSPGSSKSQLIHALAGETELKLIADNAHRYAHIQRGIAVGMKLLRDVFDGLALHTPCLFLMEDIHVIGERRPMLISDNENSKAAETSFVAENDEVHEKNQFIYQLNRHAIADYKRPYKGDFSLLIPTNHFCFDLFLGVSPPKIRKTGRTARSPFALETGFFETAKQGSNNNEGNHRENLVLKSRLQVSTKQFFAPPETSPFTILGMKDQREFKPKQVVKEMPWGGFSNDQLMLIPKVTYSIRVKIALLADLALTQLSVKLDMITDLLVIMDNVRSNRGFVVFATTHVPFVLDPALRRPGRLDETISLPFLPTLIDRFEILKLNLQNYTSTLDFMSYSFLLQNSSETDLSNFISRTKLLLLNTNQSLFSVEASFQNHSLVDQGDQTKLDLAPIYSINQAIQRLTQVEIVQPAKLAKRIQRIEQSNFSQQKNSTNLLHLLKTAKTYSGIFSEASTILSNTYSQIGKFMIQSQLLSDTRSFRLIAPSLDEAIREGEETIFRNLYSSSLEIQNTLMLLLSGKVGEFFLFNHFTYVKHMKSVQNAPLSWGHQGKGQMTATLKPALVQPALQNGLWTVSRTAQTQMNTNEQLNAMGQQARGLEEFWSAATSFVFALVQKRHLYHKTLLTNRLLYFTDLSMLREPPSPPGSSVLLPAKKYETLKRAESDFEKKSVHSILEKIQLHQQQRFMKNLYERPVREVFQSEMVKNRMTRFNSAVKELGYYDNFMRKPSSTNYYYKNRLLTRQKFSFINQWWNGQLAEHNLETTFSSDVDWRSMFVESFGDLVIDFPDADQYYNPKSRRWFLQSTYGGYWNSFEKNLPFEIYQHFILLCFNRVFNYLNTEREILDYLAYSYLTKSSLTEIDLISALSRFYLNSQCQPSKSK